MDGWINGWIDGWMDEWMDEWIGYCTSCNNKKFKKNFKKV